MTTFFSPAGLARAGLVLATLIWGSSFTLLKFVLASYDPVWIIFSRLVIAALVLLPLAGCLGPVRLQRGDWKWLVLMAFCEPVLYFLLETEALRLTSSAAAATVIALLPMAVAVATHWVLQERVTARLWRGLLIALAGTLLLTWSGQPTPLAPAPWLGNSLELLAMLAAVGYTLTAKRLSARYSALFLTAAQTGLGSVFYLPFLLLTPAPGGPFPWPAALALVYLGAVVSGFAYFLYNAALSRLPASQVSLYASLIPVFAAFFGWLLLEEPLNGLQGVAIGLVLGGVIYSQGTPRAARRTIEQPQHF